MIKSKEDIGPYIDLSGPDGNAFALLGFANSFAKEQGKDPNPILEEMQSGDYDNLVDVMEREFGDVITFYR